MKRFIIFSIIFLLGAKAWTQTEFFLPDTNSYFSVSTYKYWFHGDTLIDGMTYKKVFQQEYEPTADIRNAQYFASVREDTLNERIYCIQKDDGIERLLYDFSLEPGDTISVYSFWPFFNAEKRWVEVINVDSVKINDQYRKRISLLSEFNNEDIWIEGIGSTFGLFFSFPFAWADVGLPELLCLTINDTTYDLNPYQDGCYLEIWVSIDEVNKAAFKIYPTKVKDKLIIERSNQDDRELLYFIVDVQGTTIQYGRLDSSSIDVSFLQEGKYFLVIQNKGKTLPCNAYKFIKI
jgi:hypothetical protein